MSAFTNYGGGPYSDALMQHVRPEHDPKLWHEARVMSEECKGELIPANIWIPINGSFLVGTVYWYRSG